MKKLLTIFFSFIAIISFAQNGPGGIGNTNGSSDLVLWLKANDINQVSGTSVLNWFDKSGHGNDASVASTAPTFLKNQLNGEAVVNFNASAQQSLMIDHDNSFNSDFVTVFVIARMNATSESKGTFLIKTSGNNMSDGFGLIRLNSQEKIRFFAGDYGVNRDSEHIHYGMFDLLAGNFRTGTSTNKIVALVNNAGGTTNVTGTGNPSSNELFIGARPNNSGVLKSYLDGDIAEVVIIANDMPSTDRIIVSNYLAAKYGFGISNSKYSYHVTHPNDVIGIGMYKDQKHSSSTAGILELKENLAKELINGNFLMIGHDGAPMTTITTNMTPDFSQRFERTWRSHVNGNIIKEKLHFHVGGMDLPTNVDDYALLLDLDGDGDFSNATAITPDIYDAANNIVKFNNVHLHTGALFTLAFYQSITWDGNVFANGSGINESPNETDGGRRFIVSGSGAVISNDASVYSIEAGSSSTIQVDSTVCFTVNSKIHNDGIINIEEDASLIQRTIGDDMNTGFGTYTIKQTGLNSNHGYNNWSSPVKNQDLKLAFPDVNDCDLLTYSAFWQDWKYDFASGYSTVCNGNPVTFNSSHSIIGGDGFMNIARGYFITGNTTNPQKTFEGQINNGRIKHLIVATEFGNHSNWDDDDWNFVGNPYPSALDPFAFWQENAIDNQRITDAIYFWNDAGTPGAAYDQYNDYSSWNLTGGIASDNSSKVIDTLNHIGVGQGMMVWADTTGWDTIGHFGHGAALDTLYLDTLVFTNSMRSCKNGLFFKTQQSQKELAWLLIETPTGKKSKFLLGTVPGATDAIDNGYDARRVSYTPGVEFSSMVLNDTTSYSIQGLNPLDVLNANKRVSLKVVSDEGGLHTISRAAFETGGAPVKMYLKDNLLNIIHDLDNGDYQVYLNSNTRDLSRFEIVFEYDALNNQTGGSKGGATSVEDIDNHFDLTPIHNGFMISSTNGITGNILVYDVAGHIVYQETLTSVVTNKTITLSNTTGIYIVKVTDQNGDIHAKRTLVN